VTGAERLISDANAVDITGAMHMTTMTDELTMLFLAGIFFVLLTEAG
jgi:hypothetical protein